MIKRVCRSLPAAAGCVVLALGILLAVGALLPVQAEETPSQDYSHTAALLNQGLGARAMGMGGAAAAIATDASAVYYNPALLALLYGNSVVSSYASNWGALGYLNLAYARPDLGVGILRMAAGGEGADEFGNPGPSYRVEELASLAGAGWAFSPSFAVGITGKYYSQTLPNTKGHGFTADVGAAYELENLRLGLVARNALGSVRYEPSGVLDPFERTWVLGAGYQVGNLLLAADVESQPSVGTVVHTGAAYDFGPAELRCGAWNPGSGWALTLGLGLRWQAIQVDYAFEAHPVSKAAHRLGAVLRF